jgi:Ca2+-binding RTX toxin-like protein
MKLRHFALPALLTVMAVAPAANAEKVDCRPADRDTTLCLKTGGWTEMTGTDRADELIGTKGPDQILGDGGNDRIFGGSGNDEIRGGSGRDHIDAGRGNDIVDARDRKRDTIDCGAGRKDVAIVDKVDRVKNCERVKRR